MRNSLPVVALSFLAVGCQIHKPIVIDFENAPIGHAPARFTISLTGRGAPGVWLIREDRTSPAGANVLVQTEADKTSYRFPICIFDDVTAKDVDISVMFRPISGEKDQAAGIVWRYQDKDNYYIVRANAMENNVVAHKMRNGKRSDLKLQGKTTGYGLSAAVPKGNWSTLRLVARGNRFVVYLNNAALFEVEDTTFAAAGKVGLWTKADSVTEFDDLRIIPLD